MTTQELEWQTDADRNYARFLSLAERLEKLMQHSWQLRQSRDAAALKLAQIRGAFHMAKAELETLEKQVAEDQPLSRAFGEYLLKEMESVPPWWPAENDKSDDG